jgi:hypothetical protein
MKMHSNVETAAGGRATEFVQRLGRLKLTGCNLLLVGRVPDDVLAVASRKLLGNASQRRLRLFVFTGSGRAAVRERVPAIDVRARTTDASVLTYAGTGDAPGVADVDATTRVDADGDLGALTAAIDEEIAAIDAAADGLEPAQLRVCFDSLEPLVADHEIPEVAQFLGDVTERVGAVNGMAHYVLPVEHDHGTVAQLASNFDATIEYRTAEDGQERWHFPGTDLSTGWFPLR